jgi:diguanylate cyclase (GGDEF)-like protein
MYQGKKYIALCTSRIFDTQTHLYIESLNEYLIANNIRLLVYGINCDIYWNEDNISAETGIFDALPTRHLDLIIIMDEKIKSRTVSEKIIAAAREEDIPVLVIDGDYPDTTSIKFDYTAGFELAVRHIIEEHHAKKPHMMAGQPMNTFSEERIGVFKKVLEENNIPFDSSMVSYGHFWSDPSRNAMREVLEKGIIPDAVICANDIMAVNVCNVLKEYGHRVPEDVIVSGFDGNEEAFFTSPMITTVMCDTDELAKQTEECINLLFNKEPVEDRKIIPRLLTNESCGCPRREKNSENTLEIINNSFYRHQDDLRSFVNMTTYMVNCDTTEEMISSLNRSLTSSMLCAVDSNCFDMEDNYFFRNNPNKWTDHLKYIYDPNGLNDENDFSYNSVFLMKRLEEFGSNGYPLLFNAIEYMNKIIGFICYNFDDYELTEYSRTAWMTNAISLGIGGYINMASQRALHEKISEMYKHDALTNLYNRVAFQNIFRTARTKPENLGKPITVIMSDLDGLKYINDHYGHADGDNAIAQLAQALLKSCPENAICSRFGGDEVFAVVFGECDADAIAASMDEALNEYNKTSGLTYFVTSSTGSYTTILDPEYDILQAIKIADEKMYEVKNAKGVRRGVALTP